MEVKTAVNLARKADDLVNIKEINPRIMVDIKYATEDNFTGKKLYDSNACFLRRLTALKLNTVQKELEKNGARSKGIGLSQAGGRAEDPLVCPSK
jgi:D-alanyl-D-alanine dipeptidase